MRTNLHPLATALLFSIIVGAQALPAQSPYVTTGIFIAPIEEGGRIFTPARLLPFGHPEALTHEFPTVQQLHGGEDQVLITIGRDAGLLLAATLQRYPTQPDSLWPYAPFMPPPVDAVRSAPVIIKQAKESPMPGLRAVAYVDRFPVSFIVDTRGLTLAERHMQHATTMGLDINRAAFLEALHTASLFVPEKGAARLVFERDPVSMRAQSQTPAWVEQLGYRPTELVAIRSGPAQMPIVQVEVSGVSRWLLFDTGDMVGVSLTTSELARQSLPIDSTWRRRDSDGRIVGVFRRLRGSSAKAFGRSLGDLPIFEIDDPMVPGLIGPDLLPGHRFTLDYRAGLLAITYSALGTPPAEFIFLPLVHSSRHPRLILAYCTIAGRSVLTEFDTGKSRTVIDPELATQLGLVSNERGVQIDSLLVGNVPFAIPSAKLVSLADIDRSLPTPIQLSVGSDVMSQLLITVDYATNRLIFRRQPSR